MSRTQALAYHKPHAIPLRLVHIRPVSGLTEPTWGWHVDAPSRFRSGGHGRGPERASPYIWLPLRVQCRIDGDSIHLLLVSPPRAEHALRHLWWRDLTR